MIDLVASALKSQQHDPLYNKPLLAALNAARWLWHDSVCCASSGFQSPEVRALWAQHREYAPGDFSVPGLAGGLNVSAAAFVNAVAICRDEACEGLAIAHGRPGVAIIAALAYLQGFEQSKIVDALEICASQLPASLYLPVSQGSLSRNTYLGRSAWLGLMATISAAAGIGAPQGAAQSYAQMILQRQDPAAIAIHPTWLIEQSYWKPYACVRHVQYGASAALTLRQQIADPDSIDAIRLHVYPEAIAYCGNRAPRQLISAQFSLSHGIAAMLRFGALGPYQYRDEALADPVVQRLEAMVQLIARPVTEHPPGPLARGADLEIRCDGQWLRASVQGIDGDPGQPASVAQRVEKFMKYCNGDAAMLRPGGSSAQFTSFVQAEIGRWAEAVKFSGARVD